MKQVITDAAIIWMRLTRSGDWFSGAVNTLSAVLLDTVPRRQPNHFHDCTMFIESIIKSVLQYNLYYQTPSCRLAPKRSAFVNINIIHIGVCNQTTSYVPLTFRPGECETSKLSCKRMNPGPSTSRLSGFEFPGPAEILAVW